MTLQLFELNQDRCALLNQKEEELEPILLLIRKWHSTFISIRYLDSSGATLARSLSEIKFENLY